MGRVRREKGQATVEFALVIPILLLLVVGGIQFGLAFNYWLDLNDLSKQAARWAVVDRIPGNDNPTGNQIEQYVKDQMLTQGLRDAVAAEGANGVVLCLEDDGSIGQAATVKVRAEYNFPMLFGIGSITLAGSSTQRIEQQIPASRQAGWTVPPATCPS